VNVFHRFADRAGRSRLTNWFADVDMILKQSMAIVVPDVPIETEGSVSFRWSKQAQLLRNDQGQIVPWIPPGDEKYTPPEPILAEVPADSSPASCFTFIAEERKSSGKAKTKPPASSWAWITDDEIPF